MDGPVPSVPHQSVTTLTPRTVVLAPDRDNVSHQMFVFVHLATSDPTVTMHSASDSTRVTHKFAHRKALVLLLVSASAVPSGPVTTVTCQFVTEFRPQVSMPVTEGDPVSLQARVNVSLDTIPMVTTVVLPSATVFSVIIARFAVRTVTVSHQTPVPVTMVGWDPSVTCQLASTETAPMFSCAVAMECVIQLMNAHVTMDSLDAIAPFQCASVSMAPM